MGSRTSATRTIPLIPLPPSLLLLPGTTLRVPIQGRADLAALLANIYSRASSEKSDSIVIGCVPLNSTLVSRDGRKLLGESEKGGQGRAFETDPVRATKDDLFGFVCIGKVSAVQGRRAGELSLIVEGISRARVISVDKERPYFEAKVVELEDEAVDTQDPTLVSLFAELKQLSREILALVRLASILPQRQPTALSPIIARRLEIYVAQKDIQEAGTLADFMANVIERAHEDNLLILSGIDIKDRLHRVNETLQKEITKLQGNGRILTITATTTAIPAAPGMDSDIVNKMKQYREMLRRPGGNLPGGMAPPGFGTAGPGGEEEPNEIEELKKRLDEAKMPPDAKQVANRELQRLQKMNPAQAEYQVCRNYLENLAEIPWSIVTEDNLNTNTLGRAKQQLDDDHYGLDKIKKRLLEYLAVLKLKQKVNIDLDNQITRLKEQAKVATQDQEDQADKNVEDARVKDEEHKLLTRKRLVDKSPILLLVGPPGVGKTSLAKSVATALGRKFHRISLGGVRDEAEIRGHRRTYVAAMPGLIVNGLKKVGVANPVFLLDEIDKLSGSNFNGDPSAAMLEVLDPEQNHTFTDHYVNIPIDLSKVLFIATANSLDTIPPPLLDRMETISLSGYTTLEKRHIATRHLLPKQVTVNGLGNDKVSLTDEVLDKIITAYTRESGVRNLEREIGSVCRFKAVEYAEAADQDKLASYTPSVPLEALEEILGTERFEEEIAETSARPGVVTGLVAYSTGGQGSILFIEVADMPGTGVVQLTGKLGKVLQESVSVALTWVKAHAYELNLTHDPTEDIMKSRSIHVHCPQGAIPKDGPSAGLAHTIALISLFSGTAVPPTIAMTGEVSLRGKVTPVGGIKEKLIGALRAGVKTVLLPVGNRKDVKDLPEEVKRGLEIVPVGHIWEALRVVWPDKQWDEKALGWESRL